ncbi:hypothetical protein [uncultured Dokdonia sp.]|uniref:hypothetical protein n=1 Tax=uncultured Dokdonia sp. TaxID=575653 RepID=UPI002617421D|nr:hypothetical protein [uncultured Dokdonia sp.]
MKYIQFLCALVLAGCLAISCSEDHDCEEGVIETPNAVAPINGADYTTSLLDCRLPKVQTFTIQGFEGGLLFGTQGGVINIPGQTLFNEDGTPIDGEVEVSLLEMFTSGDIVACQLSTNTRNAAGTIEPTLSEGLLFFDIRFNGNPVVIQGEIQIFIPEENNAQEQLLFNSPSCSDIDCMVTWENTGIAFPTEIIDPNGNNSNGYSGITSQTGWYHIGQFNPNQNERTIVYNVPPPGFNDTNSNVFFRYNNDKIAVSLFEQYDIGLGVFSEVYSEIPIETQGQLIFVSRQDGIYMVDTSEIRVTQNNIGATTTTIDATEEELITVINSL